MRREYVVLDQAAGSIACRFRARRASRAVSWNARPNCIRVLIGGEAPGPSHGVDVDENGNGLLREGRLYQLVRQDGEVRERTMEITFLEPGAEASVFTFGQREMPAYLVNQLRIPGGVLSLATSTSARNVATRPR
jgi:hypothetical protein